MKKRLKKRLKKSQEILTEFVLKGTHKKINKATTKEMKATISLKPGKIFFLKRILKKRNSYHIDGNSPSP